MAPVTYVTHATYQKANGQDRYLSCHVSCQHHLYQSGVTQWVDLTKLLQTSTTLRPASAVCLWPHHTSHITHLKGNMKPQYFLSSMDILIMWPLASEGDTLICHTTMCRNSIKFLYSPGHVTLWCLEVVPVANPREGIDAVHLAPMQSTFSSMHLERLY